jgi:hypothetical protein
MPNVYEGFDQQRAQDPNKSAKDSFLDLSRRAPDAPLNDKAALGNWFQQYIQGGMNDRGHRVSSVQGDKFTYGNHEGNFTVDFGRGAGAEGGALAWQADPADDATRARYPGSAPPGAQAAAPMRSGQSDLMSMILASLQAQQQIDPQALLQQQLR